MDLLTRAPSTMYEGMPGISEKKTMGDLCQERAVQTQIENILNKIGAAPVDGPTAADLYMAEENSSDNVGPQEDRINALAQPKTVTPTVTTSEYVTANHWLSSVLCNFL